MYTTLYAFLALPVLYGLVYLFGAIRIYRHEPLLGVLSFLFMPVGLYATVRYWGAEEDNPRVPVLASLALLGLWLGMLAYGAGDEPSVEYGGDYVELAQLDQGDPDPTAARIRRAVAIARLPFRGGAIDLPDAQARIEVPAHFRFVSIEALREAGIDSGQLPHAKGIGWIVHESVDLAAAEAWYIEVDWFGEGFVSAGRLTAYGNDALLAEARATAARLSALEEVDDFDLVRFAETPVFDVSEARLTWVEEIARAGDGGHVLDCYAIKLGRGGALQYSISSMEPRRQELCLRAVRLAAGSSRFDDDRAFADYSRLFDSKSPFDLVDLVTGRYGLPET